MLTLKHILEDLEVGEFKLLSLSGGIDDTGEITPEKYPQVIPHINRALSALHGRFGLSTKEVVVQQYEHITAYTLDSRFAETNKESDVPIKYIKDSRFFPFEDDILRIERISDEGGKELYLNDENRRNSVFLSAYNIVQVPNPSPENAMSVTYRANHKKIPTDIVDASAVEVKIPEYLVEPLLAYISHRVYLRSNDAAWVGMSNTFFAKYMGMCDDVERRSLNQIESNRTSTSLTDRGWV